MTNKLTLAELRSQLGYFIGTEAYHRWSGLFRNAFLTDGAKFLADEAGAYWLMDMIASYLPSIPKDEYFVVARLTLDMTGGADFKMEDGNGEVYAHQRVEFTDFPLPEGTMLYAQTDGERWVILLPSEY